MHTVVSRLRRVTEIQKARAFVMDFTSSAAAAHPAGDGAGDHDAARVHGIPVRHLLDLIQLIAHSDKLGTSSGFQSFQFRLFENKLGIASAHRIQYHQQAYSCVA